MEIPTTDLNVTILGSGTCVPSLERSACAVLMETAGKRLLFDIGPGTMRRLLEAGRSIFDIDYLFISHFHPDHIGELVTFLFATRYPDITSRKKPLTLIGGPGFREFYNRLNALFHHWIELPGILNIIELDIIELDTIELDTSSSIGIEFDGFAIRAASVAHRPESVAYRVIPAHGGDAVYSGDTDYSENLIRLAEAADLLICESALPDEFKVEGHMTPAVAGRTATAAGVKQLILTHFYPQCDQADMKRQCRTTYDGPVMLAYDLMTLTVRKS